MKPVCIAVALLLSLPAFAAHVSGRVYVQLQERGPFALSPQAWTPVYLDSLETETDSSGAFVFEDVGQGKRLLRCEVLGTEDASAYITISDRDIDRANLIVPKAPSYSGHDEQDMCPPILRYVGRECIGCITVDTLVNPYEPIEGNPKWGPAGPDPYAFARRFHLLDGNRIDATALLLLQPLAWCEARDTIWCVVGGGGIRSMMECYDYSHWLRTSADDGRTWSPPYHLGFLKTFSELQRHQRRCDTIRVAVQDGWLMLYMNFDVHPKLAGHPYVRVPLAVLRSDRDGDGLTDLMEPFFDLDPDNPDTDGDGIRDKQDHNPLVPEEHADEIGSVVWSFKQFDEYHRPLGLRFGVSYMDLQMYTHYRTWTRWPNLWNVWDQFAKPTTRSRLFSLFTDTSDILLRPVYPVEFTDRCVRALPVEQGWVFNIDPRRIPSFNDRITCYGPQWTGVIGWDDNQTTALVWTPGYMAGNIYRMVFHIGQWRFAGEVRGSY
jgi:hypothetical protein